MVFTYFILLNLWEPVRKIYEPEAVSEQALGFVCNGEAGGHVIEFSDHYHQKNDLNQTWKRASSTVAENLRSSS